MKFWILIIFCIAGAALAGYSSGNYDGARSAKIEANQFLREFANATAVTDYLEQSGQRQWSGRLVVYGLSGESGYSPVRRRVVIQTGVGVICVSIGLAGFLFLRRREPASKPIRV
jgi:hypothetical protein